MLKWVSGSDSSTVFVVSSPSLLPVARSSGVDRERLYVEDEVGSLTATCDEELADNCSLSDSDWLRFRVRLAFFSINFRTVGGRLFKCRSLTIEDAEEWWCPRLFRYLKREPPCRLFFIGNRNEEEEGFCMLCFCFKWIFEEVEDEEDGLVLVDGNEDDWQVELLRSRLGLERLNRDISKSCVVTSPLLLPPLIRNSSAVIVPSSILRSVLDDDEDAAVGTKLVDIDRFLFIGRFPTVDLTIGGDDNNFLESSLSSSSSSSSSVSLSWRFFGSIKDTAETDVESREDDFFFSVLEEATF